MRRPGSSCGAASRCGLSTSSQSSSRRRTAARAFAELVCSNSLRANNVENAVGLLKEEMRRLGSLVMEAADVCRVPAGGALAVDREGFSAYITERLKGHPLVEFCSEEVTKLPQGLSVVATGPLTTAPLFDAISREFGAQHLSFF